MFQTGQCSQGAEPYLTARNSGRDATISILSVPQDLLSVNKKEACKSLFFVSKFRNRFFEGLDIYETTVLSNLLNKRRLAHDGLDTYETTVLSNSSHFYKDPFWGLDTYETTVLSNTSRSQIFFPNGLDTYS